MRESGSRDAPPGRHDDPTAPPPPPCPPSCREPIVKNVLRQRVPSTSSALALIVIALFGASVTKMILVIAVLSWPQLARVVRATVASLNQSQFVDAARVAGMGSRAIILREILPNVAAPIVVIGSLDIAAAILIEASLSFFGLGDPNQVSWGAMLNDAQQYLRSAWWMSAFPGLGIALTVLSFNLLGDALNDALNPRGEQGA